MVQALYKKVSFAFGLKAWVMAVTLIPVIPVGHLV